MACSILNARSPNQSPLQGFIATAGKVEATCVKNMAGIIKSSRDTVDRDLHCGNRRLAVGQCVTASSYSEIAGVEIEFTRLGQNDRGMCGYDKTAPKIGNSIALGVSAIAGRPARNSNENIVNIDGRIGVVVRHR